MSERWLLRYRIDGDLRFISHRDTIRMFERALARAALPVRFSEGFNPHARLSIPLPRPVGVASDDDALVVELDRPMDRKDLLRRIGEQMPDGVALVDARRLEPGERVVPAAVRYRLETSEEPGEDWDRIARRILDAGAIEVQRTSHKTQRTRSVDIRPSIEDLRVTGEGVEFTLRVSGSGTVKPAEIAAQFGFDPAAINHRIRRLEVRWSSGDAHRKEKSVAQTRSLEKK